MISRIIEWCEQNRFLVFHWGRAAHRHRDLEFASHLHSTRFPISAMCR